jgi:hypothetical protein
MDGRKDEVAWDLTHHIDSISNASAAREPILL